jgi:hypothetical protein
MGANFVNPPARRFGAHRHIRRERRHSRVLFFIFLVNFVVLLILGLMVGRRCDVSVGGVAAQSACRRGYWRCGALKRSSL